MNQFQWTFLDNKQQRHTLGIAHGPTSGHLVVHCDHRVVLIEFSVLEAKTFSFFIEDELCKLELEGDSDSGFTYQFHIDEEVDTELNRKRSAAKKREKLETIIRGILFFSLPVVILGALFLWGYSNHLKALPGVLVSRGVRTYGKLIEFGELEYIAGSEIFREEPLGQDQNRLVRLSLQPGDSIPLLFDVNNARHFIVDWRRAVLPFKQDSMLEKSLLEGLKGQLSNRLPLKAGSPECALLTSLRMSGYDGLLGLIDAYTLDNQIELERWTARYKEPAYQNRLQEVCPL